MLDLSTILTGVNDCYLSHFSLSSLLRLFSISPSLTRFQHLFSLTLLSPTHFLPCYPQPSSSPSSPLLVPYLSSITAFSPTSLCSLPTFLSTSFSTNLSPSFPFIAPTIYSFPFPPFCRWFDVSKSPIKYCIHSTVLH